MRILHVISSLDPQHGGVSEGVRQLADVSIDLGCEVEAATLDDPQSGFLDDYRFPVHALGPGHTHFRYAARLQPWLLQHLKSFDIVVAHALWQYHTVAVRRAALETNVPYVVYVHGMLDPYFKRNFPLKHAKKWLFWPWADYRVLRDARAVLFTTAEERILARQSFWLYRANEVLAPLGTARTPGSGERQKRCFFDHFPALRGRRLAVFLGRIHPKKGCDLAIRAFAQTLAKEPDWQLVMAGPDQIGWQTHLRELAQTLGVAARITWTGMLASEEKWGALQNAEFLFLPSHQENFGVVVAEALACGTPVLISDKVNIWREVEEFHAGFVAPDTAEGATRLLRRWMALGAEGQTQMRLDATACFAEKFEIRTATANLLRILETYTICETPTPVLANA